MKGLGLIICRQGNFQFSLNQKKHFAGAGESLFIPEDGEFQVLQESEDMEVRILIYQIEPIRDIMGNLVVSMYMYSRLTPEEPSCVWSTGEEEEIVKYMSLLDNVLQSEENPVLLHRPVYCPPNRCRNHRPNHRFRNRFHLPFRPERSPRCFRFVYSYGSNSSASTLCRQRSGH